MCHKTKPNLTEDDNFLGIILFQLLCFLKNVWCKQNLYVLKVYSTIDKRLVGIYLIYGVMLLFCLITLIWKKRRLSKKEMKKKYY